MARIIKRRADIESLKTAPRIAPRRAPVFLDGRGITSSAGGDVRDINPYPYHVARGGVTSARISPLGLDAQKAAQPTQETAATFFDSRTVFVLLLGVGGLMFLRRKGR